MSAGVIDLSRDLPPLPVGIVSRLKPFRYIEARNRDAWSLLGIIILAGTIIVCSWPIEPIRYRPVSQGRDSTLLRRTRVAVASPLHRQYLRPLIPQGFL